VSTVRGCASIRPVLGANLAPGCEGRAIPKKLVQNRLSSEFDSGGCLWPPLTTRVTIRRCGVANPGILGKPFVCHSAKRTKCVTEKYRSGVKGLVVSLHPSRNGSLGLRTTNHHDTHVTFLSLWRYASRITGLGWRNDEATVTISRQCQGARECPELPHRPVSVVDDRLEDRPCFADVGGRSSKPAQTRIGIRRDKRLGAD
jgi:hypothetical protein